MVMSGVAISVRAGASATGWAVMAGSGGRAAGVAFSAQAVARKTATIDVKMSFFMGGLYFAPFGFTMK